MRLAQQRKTWPPFALPAKRGVMIALDVMVLPAGPARDQAIHAWCAGVWDAFRGSHEDVARLLSQQGICPMNGTG